MKNILFLEQFSNISGGQKVLLQIIEYLDKTKFKPLVIIPSMGDLSLELDRINVGYLVLPVGAYSAGQKSIFDVVLYLCRLPYLVFAAMRVIKINNIDLVYANAPRTFIFSAIAGKFTGKPVLWHLHSILSGLNLRVIALIARIWVSKIICVSKSAANPLLNMNPFLGEKISVVYNGVEIEKYEMGGDKPKNIDVPYGNKVIGYIGQVAEWKGIEDFIRAAFNVVAEYSNTTFLIVGDVMFDNKSVYKDYLVKLAADLNLSQKILFLGRRDDVRAILSLLDLFVLPSIEPDPCPLALLEAMAAGKAIIASNHGGPSEIIKNGVDGILYTPKSIDALSSSMIKLLTDESLARKLAENAQKKVFEHYNAKRFREEINIILEETVPIRSGFSRRFPGR